MPSLPQFLRRDDESSSSSGGISFSGSNGPIYIAGIAIACALICGLLVWLIIRHLRQRSRAKREDKRGAAFLSVRGVVREDGMDSMPDMVHSLQGQTFSRDQLGNVVLPDKISTRPNAVATNEDVMEFHRQSGNFPQPFTPKPFSFALGSTSPSSPSPNSSAGSRSSWIRQSFMSAASSVSRFSVMSTGSSIASSPTTGTQRRIRQMFSPILPDELVVSLGETLTLVQSFDDGWCVVGRESSSALLAAPKSLFNKSQDVGSSIEMGVVPAWCFLKPVKGLRAERPIRSSSLGITVQMEAPGVSNRDDIISWSNF